MQENKRGNNRGITLIALIASVLVLIILLGLSIGAIFNSGIIDKAKQTSERMNNKLLNGQIETDNIINDNNKLDTAINGWQNTECNNHIYSWNVTQAATCVEDGTRTGTCLVCGQNTTETIAKTGIHTFSSGVCVNCGIACTHSFTNDVCTICKGKICHTESCSGSSTGTCPTCSGAGTVTYTCTDGKAGTRCSTCSGQGYTFCGGEMKIIGSHDIPACTGPTCNEGPSYDWRCVTCGKTLTEYYCRACAQYFHGGSDITCSKEIDCANCVDGYIGRVACKHKKYTSHQVTETCSTCNGTKTATIPCEHGATEQHRYCSHYQITDQETHIYY